MAAQRLFAVLFLFAGLWGCAVAHFWLWLMPGGNEHALAVPALLVAISMCAAGALWIARPIPGIALAIASMAPQTFSFACGPVAYALHPLPNLRVEFAIPGPGGSPVGDFLHPLSGIPQYMLRTDASYLGIGIGVELVSLTVLILLLFALNWQRRSISLPNQSSMPTPSARPGSRHQDASRRYPGAGERHLRWRGFTAVLSWLGMVGIAFALLWPLI